MPSVDNGRDMQAAPQVKHGETELMWNKDNPMLDMEGEPTDRHEHYGTDCHYADRNWEIDDAIGRLTLRVAALHQAKAGRICDPKCERCKRDGIHANYCAVHNPPLFEESDCTCQGHSVRCECCGTRDGPLYCEDCLR